MNAKTVNINHNGINVNLLSFTPNDFNLPSSLKINLGLEYNNTNTAIKYKPIVNLILSENIYIN